MYDIHINQKSCMLCSVDVCQKKEKRKKKFGMYVLDLLDMYDLYIHKRFLN